MKYSIRRGVTDAGSAGAPKGLQSAAPIGARGVSDLGRRSSILICRILQFCNPLMKSEFRPPAALADPPTFHSVCFWTFCLHPMYFMVFRASEVLRIRILDAFGSRSSKHYANYVLWELRIRNLDAFGSRSSMHYANNDLWELTIRNLDTSGPKSSIHYANHVLWKLRIRILDTSGPILLRMLFPNNRSTRLSSSESIHNMMISWGRR